MFFLLLFCCIRRSVWETLLQLVVGWSRGAECWARSLALCTSKSSPLTNTISGGHLCCCFCFCCLLLLLLSSSSTTIFSSSSASLSVIARLHDADPWLQSPVEQQLLHWHHIIYCRLVLCVPDNPTLELQPASQCQCTCLVQRLSSPLRGIPIQLHAVQYPIAENPRTGALSLREVGIILSPLEGGSALAVAFIAS